MGVLLLLITGAFLTESAAGLMQIPVNHADWQLLLRAASLHCTSGH